MRQFYYLIKIRKMYRKNRYFIENKNEISDVFIIKKTEGRIYKKMLTTSCKSYHKFNYKSFYKSVLIVIECD